jgi:hypothetical protein
MATQVIHIKHAPEGWQNNPDYLYIGRYNSRYSLQRSIWHNPYSMKDLAGTPLNELEKRFSVINSFASYLAFNDNLIQLLPTLEDKTLVCWCSPQKCHGDILCNWYTWLHTLSRQNEVARRTLQAYHDGEPVQRLDKVSNAPGLEYFDEAS